MSCLPVLGSTVLGVRFCSNAISRPIFHSFFFFFLYFQFSSVSIVVLRFYFGRARVIVFPLLPGMAVAVVRRCGLDQYAAGGGGPMSRRRDQRRAVYIRMYVFPREAEAGLSICTVLAGALCSALRRQLRRVGTLGATWPPCSWRYLCIPSETY